MLEDITGEQIKDQFKSNKTLRLVTIGVGVLAIAILGYFLYKQFVYKPANEKSKDGYWAGLNYAAKDSTDLALDEFRVHSSKYDGKDGGEVSQFAYARQLMNKGEYQKALDELEGVELSDTYLSVMSVGLQGDCQSEMGNYEKAANLYFDAAEMNENELTSPMYLMKAGLCAEEIKNFEKATECYQRIKDNYSTYALRKQIDKYIARASNKTAK